MTSFLFLFSIICRLIAQTHYTSTRTSRERKKMYECHQPPDSSNVVEGRRNYKSSEMILIHPELGDNSPGSWSHMNKTGSKTVPKKKSSN
jgi:hypothetical protein